MKDRKKRENKPSITKDYLSFPRNLAPGIPVSSKKKEEKNIFLDRQRGKMEEEVAWTLFWRR